MQTRRNVLAMLAAGAIAPAANAHTMFNQWVVYRKKHLLIGSHRGDIKTYELALEVVMAMDHLLPEASARAARAPHAERLASLLGTGQLDLAIVTASDAEQMTLGVADFEPYGPIALTLVANLRSHLFLAHRDFPDHHAWLVTAVLNDIGLGYGSGEPPFDIAFHPGTAAFRDGVPVESLPSR